MWGTLAQQTARCSPCLSRCACMAQFHSLPIIDVGPLLQGSNADPRLVQGAADQLHRACSEVGFFYAANSGIPAELQSSVLQQARQWFSLPEEQKAAIRIGPGSHYRGWQALGANVTRYEGGFQRDWHEAIDLYRELPAGGAEPGGRPSPIHGANQWPTQLPSFDAMLRQYLDAMLGLGSSIMQGIALALQLPRNFFHESRAGPYWCARVIHYPPLAQGTDHRARTGGVREAAAAALQGAEVERSVQLSCGEHCDYGLLTIVNQDPHVSALQVKNAAGEWIAADPIPGTFVCNLGAMLQRYSNGLYQPTAHRVINADPEQSRVSLAFFWEPAFEAVVQPPQQVLQAHKMQQPLYPAVRYGDHLESKVLSNFEL